MDLARGEAVVRLDPDRADSAHLASAVDERATSSSGMNSYGPVKPDLLARLSRIEGRVRGIRGMVQEDKYCIDILTQVHDARRALESMGLRLLEAHAKGSVREALSEANDQDGD